MMREEGDFTSDFLQAVFQALFQPLQISCAHCLLVSCLWSKTARFQDARKHPDDVFRLNHSYWTVPAVEPITHMEAIAA